MSSGSPKVLIQRNPKSGSGLRAKQLGRLTDRLKELGFEPFVYDDRDQMQQDLSDQELRESLHCIVAAGGDGTIDDMINRYPGLPLAILAMGTENLLAKYYKTPHRGEEVADMIAAGYLRKLDLGLAGKTRFVVMASCGFDAMVVDRAHAARKGRITKLHYAWPIVRTMMAPHRTPLLMQADGHEEEFEGELVVISNISKYAANLPINPTASDDDAVLSVCVVKRATIFNLSIHALAGFVARKMESNNLVRFETRRLRIRSEKSVAVQADGDPVGYTPMEIRVLPQALDLVVPKELAHTTLHEEFVRPNARPIGQ